MMVPLNHKIARDMIIINQYLAVDRPIAFPSLSYYSSLTPNISPPVFLSLAIVITMLHDSRYSITVDDQSFQT